MNDTGNERAKQVVFTVKEMESMFMKHREGGGNYHTLEEYIRNTMNGFAEVSHGDIVLINEEQKEIRRVKGKYKKGEEFNNE